MKQEEITLLNHIDENTNEIVEQFKNKLQELGAEIVEEQDMGVRHLAYYIGDQTKAHYYCVLANIKEKNILDIHKYITRDKRIIRHLMVGERYNMR